MPLVIKTEPALEPVTVQEAKDHLRLDIADDDNYLDAVITSARQYIEHATGRALITQTWNYYLDQFGTEIDIPKPDLQSVSSIKYIDTDGVEQTLSTSIYTVDTYSTPGRVYLSYQQTWPSLRGDRNGINIEFVSGFGTEIPAQLKQAILLLTGHFYENRESTTDMSLSELPLGFDHLIKPYIVWNRRF